MKYNIKNIKSIRASHVHCGTEAEKTDAQKVQRSRAIMSSTNLSTVMLVLSVALTMVTVHLFATQIAEAGAPTGAFTVDLEDGSDTGGTDLDNDNITKDTTPSFTLGNSGAFGGAGEDVRIYYKKGTCPGTLPTGAIETALSSWTLYKTVPVTTAVTSPFNVTGIVSETAITEDGGYCFLGFHSDGTTISNPSRGTLTVTIRRSAPITLRFTDDIRSEVVTSQTLTGSVQDGKITGVAYSDDATCDANDSYTPVTKTDTHPITLTATNNGKYVCLRANSEAGDISYARSAHPVNIQLTSPTISSLTFTNDTGTSNNDKKTSNASSMTVQLSASITGTVTVYTYDKGATNCGTPAPNGRNNNWKEYGSTTISNSNTATVTGAVSEGVHCVTARYHKTGSGSGYGPYATAAVGGEITYDNTAPAINIVRVNATTVFAVADDKTTTTAKKADVAVSSCTTSISGTYTAPSDAAVNATNGTCFVFTDIAGNTTTKHITTAGISTANLAANVKVTGTDATKVGDMWYTSDTTPNFSGNADDTGAVKIWIVTDGASAPQETDAVYATQQSPSSNSFTSPDGAAQSAGNYDVYMSTNSQTPQKVMDLTISTTAPTITFESLTSSNPGNSAYAKKGDRITATFSVSGANPLAAFTPAGGAIAAGGATFSPPTIQRLANGKIEVSSVIATTGTSSVVPTIAAITGVKDAAGNDAAGAVTNTNLKIDGQSPTIASATATSNERRKTRFSFTVGGTETGEPLAVVLGGGCSEFGDKTVTGAGTSNPLFTSIARGTYSNCSISLRDPVGNIAAPLTLASFNVKKKVSSGGTRRGVSFKAPMLPTGPVTQQRQVPTTREYISGRTARFSKNLTVGSRDEEVRQLQIWLNKNGFVVARSGAGSPGQETAYFGPATRDAVKRFQEANAQQILRPAGLSTGTGYFGRSTREFLNAQAARGLTAPTLGNQVSGRETVISEPYVDVRAEKERQKEIKRIRAAIKDLIAKVRKQIETEIKEAAQRTN